MKITNIVLFISVLGLLTPYIGSSKLKTKTGTNMHFGFFKAPDFQTNNHGNQALDFQSNNPANLAPKNLTKDDLPDVPIYYEGWIKYFHYHKTDDLRPRHFFKNTKFFSQWRNSTKPDDEVRKHYNIIIT